jgi:hypothetical protein
LWTTEERVGAVRVSDLLTAEECARVFEILSPDPLDPARVSALVALVVEPAIERIRRRLALDVDPRYVAHMLAVAFYEEQFLASQRSEREARRARAIVETVQ